MNDTEFDLDNRLVAIAARAPGADPPSLMSRRPRGRVAVSSLLGAAAVLALVATAASGAAVIVNDLVRGYPGIENPGEALAGAQMECMSPPQAAAFLAAHGYTNVVWQVEAGDPSGVPRSDTSVLQATPPEHGYVNPAAVLSDGKLHMVVDQRKGATPSGACPGMPMP
jgi:hypothetical protein